MLGYIQANELSTSNIIEQVIQSQFNFFDYKSGQGKLFPFCLRAVNLYIFLGSQEMKEYNPLIGYRINSKVSGKTPINISGLYIEHYSYRIRDERCMNRGL